MIDITTKQKNLIILRDDKVIAPKDLIYLFSSVGWCKNIRPHDLARAIRNSTNVITAWQGDILVGLVRSMDDGCWQSNIDCIVVHKDYQQKGIGSRILKALLDRIDHIEYISVSSNKIDDVKFYEKFGFKAVDDSRLLQICK